MIKGTRLVPRVGSLGVPVLPLVARSITAVCNEAGTNSEELLGENASNAQPVEIVGHRHGTAPPPWLSTAMHP